MQPVTGPWSGSRSHLYAVVPQLIDRPFTLGWVGAYFVPDIVLIRAAAIGADLVQRAYKGIVIARRAGRGSAPAGLRRELAGPRRPG